MIAGSLHGRESQRAYSLPDLPLPFTFMLLLIVGVNFQLVHCHVQCVKTIISDGTIAHLYNNQVFVYVESMRAFPFL